MHHARRTPKPVRVPARSAPAAASVPDPGTSAAASGDRPSPSARSGGSVTRASAGGANCQGTKAEPHVTDRSLSRRRRVRCHPTRTREAPVGGAFIEIEGRYYDLLRTPTAEVLVEGSGVAEHEVHTVDFSGVPPADVLVEDERSF